MVAVKIISIGKEFEVKTQYGLKAKMGIVVKDLSTGNSYDATMFVPKDGFVFKTGDEVLADIQISGKYINIKKLEPLGVKEPTFQGTGLPPKVGQEPKKVPEEDENFPFDVEDKDQTWLDYRQRLNEILELFKEIGVSSDTSLSSAILGLREMMFGKKYER